MHEFSNIRLHRNDSDKESSFYWSIKTGRKVSTALVMSLAETEDFFTPELQMESGFMNSFDVIKFTDANNWLPDELWNGENMSDWVTEYGAINVPCSVIRPHLTQQQWKTLQSKVSTWIPENKLKSL